MRYILKWGALKDGKRRYQIEEDGHPVLETKPLTIEERARLERAIKKPGLVPAWIARLQKGNGHE